MDNGPYSPRGESLLSSKSEDEVERSKAFVSLASAALLLSLLVGFALLLGFGKAFLSRSVGQHMSTYVLIMIGLAMFCWFLTWLYTLVVDRLEQKAGI